MDSKSFLVRGPASLSLLAIVLLSAALRFYHLGYHSLWVDEIASMMGSDPQLTTDAVIQYSVGDQPPSFFLLLHYWLKVFPYNDWYGRLLAVLIGLISIVAVFFLGREVRDKETGLIAALITSFSYIHIYFSQEVRFYTLVFLTATLSCLFFIRATKSEKLFDFILYTLSTALLIYTHYFGLVALASQGVLFVLIVWLYPVSRRFIFLSILSAIAVVILVLPWMPVFFKDAQTEQFWIPAEPIYFPIKYFYVYFKDVLSCFVFAPLILYFLFTEYKRYRNGQPVDRINFILVGGVLMNFLIPTIYSIIQTPMLQERYLIIALPSIIVIISLGFSLLKISWRNGLLIAVTCTSLFSLVYIEKFYTADRKENWRGMVAGVMKQFHPGDAIVSRYAWYCNYYFTVYQTPLRARMPYEFNLETQKPAGVWYLDGFDLRPEPNEAEVKLTQSGYVLEKTDSLYRTRASYYRLKE